jgi:hypothetical protein
MYDPAADAQHDLDPAARRSLPMYPAPDPAWTQTPGRTSGKHAVAEPADQGPAVPWTGSISDTGHHHRIDPLEMPPREIGERRRRLDPPRERGRRRIPGERSTR